ncbi:hypothetical protein BGX26_007991, partial [Mortierella sp. AD094]
MHLLMLNYPWREDVDTWIGPGKEHETYQSLAEDRLGREKVKQLADGLLVVLDHGSVDGNRNDEDVPKLPKDIQWTEDQKEVIDT